VTPELTGYATVLLVEDVPRATTYYRDRLGFEVGHYDRSPSHLALHDELVERGADLHGPPTLQGYGMYDFRVADPHGYVLGFGRAA
jgi:catechol 2,3-dioxygenase-like lactoylglutathione lyase family enzyme